MRRSVVLGCGVVLFFFCSGVLYAADASDAKGTKPAPSAPKHLKKQNPNQKTVPGKKAVNAKPKTDKLIAVSAGTHEPQSVSDAQLRRARQLLMGPLSPDALKAAHRLLVKANHDYEGHRASAQTRVEKAIQQYASAPQKAANHARKAIGEIDTALSIR
jgi:hypothetical protein